VSHADDLEVGFRLEDRLHRFEQQPVLGGDHDP
jgi:hypothetical protein